MVTLHFKAFVLCKLRWTLQSLKLLFDSLCEGANATERFICLYIVIQCMTTPHSHQRQPTSDPWKGGQGGGRAEWPGCWLRHSLTALSRSHFSLLLGGSGGEGEREKMSRTTSRAWLTPEKETKTFRFYDQILPICINTPSFYKINQHYTTITHFEAPTVISNTATTMCCNQCGFPLQKVFPRLLWCSLTLISCCWISQCYCPGEASLNGSNVLSEVLMSLWMEHFTLTRSPHCHLILS